MQSNLIIWLFLKAILITTASDIDPYQILGVKRSDSEKEIKTAYKRKALKLHPDRNKSPDAQRDMMKINEAYEILSDTERRKIYDNYGETKPDSPQAHKYTNSEYRGPRGHFSFMFEDMPFGSNYHYRNYQQQNLLTRYNYQNIILPDSVHKMFLIYVVGEVCFECYQLEPTWDKMSKGLSALGIGVYKMIYEMDRSLARDIGVNTYPQFFTVIDGRTVRYKNTDMSEREIRSWLSSLYPHYLLSFVALDFVEFFQQSIIDNKPQCLLFSKHFTPPLLFKAVAYEYHHKVRFAYVDYKNLNTKILQRKYDINTTEPVIVYLKEEPSSPIAVLRGNALARGALRRLVAGNLYLYVPRLSSQDILEDLCKKPRSPGSARFYCVIMMVEKTGNYSTSLWKMRQMVMSSSLESMNIQFTYLFTDIHEKFVDSIEGSDMHLVPCSDGQLPYRLLLISGEKDEEKVFFEWFTNGWCGTDQSVDELELFLEEHTRGSGSSMKKKTLLAVLNDEHHHGYVYGFMKHVYSGVQYLVDNTEHPSWYNLPSVAIFLLFIFVLLTFIGVPTLSYLASSSDKLKIDDLPQHMNTDSVNTTILGLRKIDHKTQKEFIHDAKPGNITIAIIVDTADIADVATSPIMQAFSDVIYAYTYTNENYTFTWLSIGESTNLLWCTEVMNVREFGAFMPGTVLAMNGYRKYVYIFKPKLVEPKAALECNSSSIAENFLGMESSDEECDNYKYLERIQYKKAAMCIRNDLPMWLERLSEGTLHDKVKIKEWPMMEPE